MSSITNFITTDICKHQGTSTLADLFIASQAGLESKWAWQCLEATPSQENKQFEPHQIELKVLVCVSRNLWNGATSDDQHMICNCYHCHRQVSHPLAICIWNTEEQVTCKGNPTSCLGHILRSTTLKLNHPVSLTEASFHFNFSPAKWAATASLEQWFPNCGQLKMGCGAPRAAVLKDWLLEGWRLAWLCCL